VTKSARRATLAVMTLVLVLLVAPIAQAKKSYPPRNPSCAVSPSKIAQAGGTVLTLTGHRWLPNSSVDLRFRQANQTLQQGGVSLGAATTDSTGYFQTTRTTPAATGAKAYVDFIGQGSNGTPSSPKVTCTVTLQVIKTVSATIPLGIPGGMILGIGILGLLLALSLVHRRRARALLKV
jgi:hypothetical protein